MVTRYTQLKEFKENVGQIISSSLQLDFLMVIGKNALHDHVRAVAKAGRMKRRSMKWSKRVARIIGFSIFTTFRTSIRSEAASIE